MNIEELQQQNDALLFDITKIKNQLEIAQAEEVTRGFHADALWLAKAKAALRHKQRQHQQVLAELTKARRELKLKYQKRLERAFVDIAREHLDAELFQFMWHKALDEANITEE